MHRYLQRRFDSGLAVAGSAVDPPMKELKTWLVGKLLAVKLPVVLVVLAAALVGALVGLRVVTLDDAVQLLRLLGL